MKPKHKGTWQVDGLAVLEAAKYYLYMIGGHSVKLMLDSKSTLGLMRVGRRDS